MNSNNDEILNEDGAPMNKDENKMNPSPEQDQQGRPHNKDILDDSRTHDKDSELQ